MQVKRKHRDVRERGVQRSHASGKKIGELREIIDLSCFNIVVLQTLSTRASAATVDSFRSISKHGDDRNKRKASSTPARAARRGWSRTSTASTPRGNPAPPTYCLRQVKVGRRFRPSMTEISVKLHLHPQEQRLQDQILSVLKRVEKRVRIPRLTRNRRSDFAFV